MKKHNLFEHRERYNRLTPETAQTICDIAGIKRHRIQNVDKEEVDMCRAWDEQEEWGRRKGKTEDICNIMNSLKITALEAMDILKIAKEEREEYLELIK